MVNKFLQMNIEEVTAYCLSKKAVSHGFPFGGDTLVFKVMNKMFALTGLESIPSRINLKCDPDRALALREEYPEDVFPGYHMNKNLWNTVIIEGVLSNKQVKEMIDHSYDLVVASFTKKMSIDYEQFDE
jgi:predicted DNA-binding protein (MmcQ/YjbR family)